MLTGEPLFTREDEQTYLQNNATLNYAGGNYNDDVLL